jgi:alanyl-tRNA synthetase
MHSLTDIRKAFLDYFGAHGHAVLPSSSLVPHNDPTLMFTNAGMVQFKNVFTGAEHLHDKQNQPIRRAATSQKCVRAGGKHNDLDNVGYTARHHTFFEMLGNFSFADYFKEGAIEHGWNLLTKTLGLPPEKLLVTVYHTDDAAFNIWKKLTGFSDSKIIRIPTKDNFWAMGDTGPCGPCSEIFYDHGDKIAGGPPGSADQDGDRFIEIWNLVFMQFDQTVDGKQTPLPKPCIDTGMGLERITTVLQGVHNNYDIDLFKNLIAASHDFSKNNDPKLVASHRVIADHLRSACFLIADGVLPSNEGRGYVLRRIMRRGMRHAHILGCKEPLMHKLVPALVKEMGAHYGEITRAQALITETLRHEEERFKETLDRGLKLLEAETASLKGGGSLKGETAFKLYDTFGFPLDLTQDILRGKQMQVDMDGFNAAMAEQKTKARAAWSGSGDKATETIWFELHENHGATEFLGYETLEGTGKLVALVKDGQLVESAKQGDAVTLIFNQTPFYAESGGQAGDKGVISTAKANIKIADTKKMVGSLHAHIGTVEKGEIRSGEDAQLKADSTRRDAIRANHSATHLLHAALRKTLGEHVTQKGSLVEADYMRFDFSHPKKVTDEELAQVEKDVNAIIKQNAPVSTRLMTPDEAIAEGAMALFGEKYGDEVRVLSMGTESGKSYSVELCGGTHVKSTGDIAKFKITKESSVASGVRRIEAKTGANVDAFLKAQEEAAKQEAARKAASEQAGEAEASKVSEIREQFIQGISQSETVGGVKFYGKALTDFPAKDLRGLVDEFKKQAGSGVVAIVASSEGKASIVVGATPDLAGKINAVDLLKKGVAILGGQGGGGRPDMAQGGGPDVSKAGDAIAAIRAAI